MAMLAERKIKQKWSLNPRGKDWSEDSNKFGQKILEKMGWTKGKGLGAKEDGIVEHVKLAYKNDSKGMGFKDRNDQWTEHESRFTALLSSLAGEAPKDNRLSFSNLEQKSQASRARVHYKKFMRGKDLSRCSEKDLANIFGKKSLNHSTEKNEEDVIITKEEVKNESFIRNGGSMVDYFKKKLPNFSRSPYKVGSNGVLKKDSDSEDERIGFGFRNEEGNDKKGLSNPSFEPLLTKVEVHRHILNTIKEENEEVEGRSNKRKEREAITEEIKEDVVSVKKTKKKKSKVKNEDSGIETSSFDELETENRKENNEIIEVKRKNCNISNNVSEIDNLTQNLNTFEVSPDDNCDVKKKPKRKKHKLNGIDSLSSNLDTSLPENDTFNDGKRKEKRRKKGIDNPSLNFDSVSLSESHNYTLEITRDDANEVKRKEKRKKNKSSGIDNPNLNLDNSLTENDSLNNVIEVKRKEKRKKSKINGIDNPNLRIDTTETQSEVSSHENVDIHEVKRKDNKKKRKLNNDITGIDNPNVNLDESFTSTKNNQFEVKREESVNKKKKRKENCFDNLALECAETEEFDLVLNVTSLPATPKTPSIKRRKSVRFSDVTQERIIPNNEDIQNRNELFDINSKIIEDGLLEKFDSLEAEVENDMNEEKINKFIGEVNNSVGEHEKLPDGTKLKFRLANFGRTATYHRKAQSLAKSSYKHLIKGDIVLRFNNTNLHEIVGYGTK